MQQGFKLQELSEVQQHKAHHLYRWARDAGKSVSRDEVADMVRHIDTASSKHLCKSACCISEDATTHCCTQLSPTALPAGVDMLGSGV